MIDSLKFYLPEFYMYPTGHYMIFKLYTVFET